MSLTASSPHALGLAWLLAGLVGTVAAVLLDPGVLFAMVLLVDDAADGVDDKLQPTAPATMRPANARLTGQKRFNFVITPVWAVRHIQWTLRGLIAPWSSGNDERGSSTRPAVRRRASANTSMTSSVAVGVGFVQLPSGFFNLGGAARGSRSVRVVTLCRSMTDQSDVAGRVSEWEFAEPDPTDGAGGGLLRQVLEEVAELRDGVAADRSALAQAITASFDGFERQLAELRDALQRAADRAAHDEAARVHAAEQNDAMALDIAALRSELDGVSKTMADATTQIAAELQRLRRALLGPN